MLTAHPPESTSQQQHVAQLAEYDALITSVHNAKVNSTPLSGLFISPQSHSLLAQEHELAQTHLKKLLDNPDYLDLLRKATGTPNTSYLAVTLKNGRAEYETAGLDKQTIPLPVADQKSLRSLAESLEKAVLNIGGQLRSDRLLRLPQILWFYGLQPEHPQSADTLSLLIQKLEEMKASYLLGLENGLELGNLIHESDHRPLLDAVSLILEADETSVIESLGKEALVNVSPDQLRATPAVYLNRLLSGTKAQALAQKLLVQLKWYGAQPGEEPAPSINNRLVAEAIRRWYSLSNDQPDDTILRFRLEQPSNWGKSYRTLRSEFETYLIDSGHVSTTNEAILLARLLQPQLPAEFQVRDIPDELPYRSSVVWVNFVHGVNLAKAIDRSLIPRMTFQQFVDFPIKKSEGAPPQLLDLIALTRIAPTLDWALTNGFLDQQLDHYHTEETILLATDELKNQTDLINEAITCLGAPTPNRLTIAKSKLVKIFGSGTFNADHTKLVEEANEYTINPIRHGGPPGRKQVNAYTFVDVYASGNIYNGKKWFFTDGVNVSDKWIKLDTDNVVESNAFVPAYQNKIVKLPDVKLLFKVSFNIHLYLQRGAYQELILSQLATLPLADRLALEYGEVKILTLRKNSSKTAERETPAVTLPLRARKGFVLAVDHENQQSYYELLPSIGVIRRLPDFKSELIGGKPIQAHWGSVPVTYLTYKTLPFDWDAHANGTQPKKNPTCEAIIDHIGETFTAPRTNENYTAFPCTLKSQRLQNITYFIAQKFFHVDEDLYRTSAYDETKFDKEQKVRDKVLAITKIIIPFWSSIEDLASGDMNKIKDGFIGIFVDVATFLLPIGKFASGSLRLATTSGKLSIRATLPSFVTLTKKLFISSLNNLNPIDGIPSLLGALGAGVFRLGKFGFFKLKGLARRPGQYDLVQGLPQATDPGRWKPLAAGDQLGSVNGIDDVVLRRADAGNITSHHLIDPQSAKPYGPRLTEDAGGVSIGRSEFAPAGEFDSRVAFDIPENARVQQIPELDGRTTLLIDDVPYRLDHGSLRRVGTIDASQSLNIQPCRIRRDKDKVCLNSYVFGIHHPTPAPGSYDPAEDFCTWFGDRIYTPAPVKTGSVPVLALDGQLYTGTGEILQKFVGNRTKLGLPKKPSSKARVEASIEFQKGIYGRIKVKGVEEGLDDVRQVGTLIIESKLDAKKEFLFTQLNANDYYFAEIAKGQSLKGPHRLQRIPDFALKNDPLYKELFTVFTGSLHANNTAAYYGIDKVKEAIRTMDEIAVPLGGLPKPADNMTKVKVSTTPGEAVMFDHQTRMIVCKYPETTKAWTRTNDAPSTLRERTAKIFNDLFNKTLFKPNEQNAIQISNTMKELQKIVTKHKPMDRPRNIAYAEITHPDGKIEVFVSVSGSGGDTRFLPLFSKTPNAKEVTIGNTTYINVDHNLKFERESLSTARGQLQAIPRTIDDMATYTPELTLRPTSLDSESKLIRVIREKYPNDATRSPVTIATTMAPCDSCSVVMQQFAHTGGKDALKVIWD